MSTRFLLIIISCIFSSQLNSQTSQMILNYPADELRLVDQGQQHLYVAAKKFYEMRDWSALEAIYSKLESFGANLIKIQTEVNQETVYEFVRIDHALSQILEQMQSNDKKRDLEITFGTYVKRKFKQMNTGPLDQERFLSFFFFFKIFDEGQRSGLSLANYYLDRGNYDAAYTLFKMVRIYAKFDENQMCDLDFRIATSKIGFLGQEAASNEIAQVKNCVQQLGSLKFGKSTILNLEKIQNFLTRTKLKQTERSEAFVKILIALSESNDKTTHDLLTSLIPSAKNAAIAAHIGTQKRFPSPEQDLFQKRATLFSQKYPEVLPINFTISKTVFLKGFSSAINGVSDLSFFPKLGKTEAQLCSLLKESSLWYPEITSYCVNMNNENDISQSLIPPDRHATLIVERDLILAQAADKTPKVTFLKTCVPNETCTAESDWEIPTETKINRFLKVPSAKRVLGIDSKDNVYDFNYGTRQYKKISEIESFSGKFNATFEHDLKVLDGGEHLVYRSSFKNLTVQNLKSNETCRFDTEPFTWTANGRTVLAFTRTSPETFLVIGYTVEQGQKLECKKSFEWSLKAKQIISLAFNAKKDLLVVLSQSLTETDFTDRSFAVYRATNGKRLQEIEKFELSSLNDYSDVKFDDTGDHLLVFTGSLVSTYGLNVMPVY